MPTATKRKYVSISDSAEYVGVSVDTIRRRIADGSLAAYRMGPKTIRVDLRDLEALMRLIPTGGGGR